MSTIANSTLEEEAENLGANSLKYVLVTAIPVVVALCSAFVFVFVVRACWRKRQGSKEYRPVPTRDIPDHPQNEQPKSKKKQVQIILPNPPPPKMKITLAPDITKSKLPYYLPHKSAATDIPCKNLVNNVEEFEPVRMPGGVAALLLKICVEYNHLMVEVQNAVGLPCRADGTPADPFVKLNVVSREEKHVRRRSCSTHPVHHSTNPQFMETLDCGQVVREELEHSILHMEVYYRTLINL